MLALALFTWICCSSHARQLQTSHYWFVNNVDIAMPELVQQGLPKILTLLECIQQQCQEECKCRWQSLASAVKWIEGPKDIIKQPGLAVHLTSINLFRCSCLGWIGMHIWRFTTHWSCVSFSIVCDIAFCLPVLEHWTAWQQGLRSPPILLAWSERKLVCLVWHLQLTSDSPLPAVIHESNLAFWKTRIIV